MLRIFSMFSFAIFLYAGSALANSSLTLKSSCRLFSSVQFQDEALGFSESEAEKLTAEILYNIGLRPNFKVRAVRNVPNAAAVLLRENPGEIGTPYILYNPEWVARYISQDKWKAIGLIAHEIGHHLQTHTLTCKGSNPTSEIEADEFAGRALAGMGAKLSEAKSLWMQFPLNGSSTHPGKNQRLAAVEKGWRGHTPSPISTEKTIKLNVIYSQPRTTDKDLSSIFVVPDSGFSRNVVKNLSHGGIAVAYVLVYSDRSYQAEFLWMAGPGPYRINAPNIRKFPGTRQSAGGVAKARMFSCGTPIPCDYNLAIKSVN